MRVSGAGLLQRSRVDVGLEEHKEGGKQADREDRREHRGPVQDEVGVVGVAEARSERQLAQLRRLCTPLEGQLTRTRARTPRTRPKPEAEP